jgi:methyltransferase (TIGR00027 family)
MRGDVDQDRKVMQTGRRSRTAEAAATVRAMHRHVDEAPLIFVDEAVEALLPAYTRRFLRRIDELPAQWLRVYRQRRSGLAQMRAQIVVRARYAEDALDRARQRGVGQYVILAAGLDTFALRDSRRDIPVFEVDHPATQLWKRSLLRAIPEHVEFVAVDFERDTLAQSLVATTFAIDTPAFVSWLGTTYYLNERALRETLGSLSSLCAHGSELVFDYWSRAPFTDGTAQALLTGTRIATAFQAEPIRSLFEPATMEALVAACGWRIREHCAPQIANARYLANRTDGLAVPSFSYFMHLELR